MQFAWSLILGVSFIVMQHPMTNAQEFVPNYDETRIPAYSLPDLLICKDGSRVADRDIWRSTRRPEILDLFSQEMFGRSPARPPLTAEIFEQTDNALAGKAIRRQVRINLTNTAAGPSMSLLLYLPKSAVSQPVPVFLGLNFAGNYTVSAESEIPITECWVPDETKLQTTGHRANPASRGKMSYRWPIARIIERGYGVATIYYGDIDPDFDDGFKNGVHPHFDGEGSRPSDAWGSLAAWAWGLSLALDYLETDEQVNAKQVAVLGHSRLGKTALWAGACDERFAMVISNDSGCGGAALSRRKFGETVGRITRTFPHWFCRRFAQYQENEDALPFDQHMVLALIAPRPLYVCSASEDLWADPRGEFLSAVHAGPAFELFALSGLVTNDFPPINQPLGEQIGYHLRGGGHELLAYDWEQFMNFADRHFRKLPK